LAITVTVKPLAENVFGAAAPEEATTKTRAVQPLAEPCYNA